jgi:phospholipase/carboxylesterase
MNLLPTVEIDPRGEHRFSVIWLHGLGADGNDFLPIVDELRLTDALGLRFVFPHAPVRPVSINGGYEMRAWYDIAHPDLSQGIDRSGIAASVAQVRALVAAERERYGLDAGQILLAGFSQGGVIALCTAVGLTDPPRGLLALSTYLACPEAIRDVRTVGALPIFQAHGRQDPVVVPALGRAARDELRSLGHRVEWHEYDMPHAVCPQEIEDIRAWLIAELSGG